MGGLFLRAFGLTQQLEIEPTTYQTQGGQLKSKWVILCFWKKKTNYKLCKVRLSYFNKIKTRRVEVIKKSNNPVALVMCLYLRGEH